MRLSDKVIVITGGSSGIGAACAKRFVAEGARVVIADIDASGAEQLCSQYSTMSFVATDVTDSAALEELIASVVNDFGRLDVFVNNAGIDPETSGLTDGDTDLWLKTIAINQTAVMLAMRFALKQMQHQRSGVILNVASTAGLVAFAGRPAYSATKAAVIQLTRAAAIENAEFGIRVNALCPGCVQTPVLDDIIQRSESPDETRERIETMNPLAGIIPVEQVAATAAFMVSDETTFMTGVALPLDGGYTAQ